MMPERHALILRLSSLDDAREDPELVEGSKDEPVRVRRDVERAT